MVEFEEKVAEDIKLIYIVFLIHLDTTSVKIIVLFKCTYCILLQTGIFDVLYVIIEKMKE